MVRAFAISGMLFLIGTCATAGIWPAWQDDAHSMTMPCSNESNPQPQPWVVFHYRGSPSCGNQSCHGQSSSHPVGGEHQIWIEQDPHAKALGVLHNEDSARIVQALRMNDPSRPKHAYEDQSCLGCHAMSYSLTTTDVKIKKIKLTEAVSCEACHGPAERWLAEHYLSSWTARSNEEKRKSFGFISTKDPGTRIDQCAACHIGSAGREVNHDLIAAGHPRLAFEYTRFHYAPQYGKHWMERESNPEFEIRAWFIGQVSAMRTVVALLHARLEEKQIAEANHKSLSRPWPELSEMSCYACHQGIDKQHVRSLSGKPTEHSVGTPGWNLWYFSLIEVLQHQTALVFPGANTPKLSALKELLKLMRSSPNQTVQLLKLNTQAQEELSLWQNQLQDKKLNVQAARQLLLDIATHALREYDWDYVTQHYLGCAMLVHAHADQQASPFWNEAKTLVQQLRLVLKFPDDVGTMRLNSPRDYDPEKVKALFQELRRLAAAPGSK